MYVHYRFRILFGLAVILAFSAVTAINSLRAMFYESYNKESYSTNLRGLIISGVIFVITALVITSMVAWYEEAISLD